MRLLLNETDKRLEVKLDRSIKSDNDVGIMNFGEFNNYPQLLERIILSSIDARAIADIYARFLIGQGFNDTVNNIVVGKDSRGKDITVLSLLREYAKSASFYAGGYVHVNFKGSGEVVSAKHIPFKNCRFTKPNDMGYCAKIAVYENWEKDKDTKFDKSKIRFYHTFNSNYDVLLEQFKNAGKPENHKGQIYFLFLDNYYLYPLSPFDPVYMDCDTQAQISIFKNNQIRNGFSDKTVFRVAGDEDSVKELKEGLTEMMGAAGSNCAFIKDSVDPTSGQIEKNRDVVAEKIPTNINDKLFESWEAGLVNNLRKANKAVPQILIDYDSSKLGTTSGEAITQAVAFYNAMTDDDRSAISQMFRDILSKFDNSILQANQDWTIKPLDLAKFVETESVELNPVEVRLKSQAELKGSVGGVTALIQLQQSVSQGYTTKSAAIAILEEIYGISRETAINMIGNPENETNGSNTESSTNASN